MALLREGWWGNNQAPEPGVRAFGPPVLQGRATRGKMAAEPALPSRGAPAKDGPSDRCRYRPRLCAAFAASSWIGGSRSIQFSEQRAPGLAAVRIKWRRLIRLYTDRFGRWVVSAFCPSATLP